MAPDRLTDAHGRRCEDCGGYTFFNHAVSSTGGGTEGWRHTHGGCERAGEVLAEMPVLYDMAIQSCVETAEALGRFVAGVDDDEWNDPQALQRLILDAYNRASEGIRTEARWLGA